jgi:putative sporulation protein YtaF
MSFSVFYFLEIFLLVIALSIDSFVASFAYGANKIKIPILSVAVINIICTLVLGISLFLGSAIGSYIPASLTKIICFSILFLIGLIKLFDSTSKSFIKKNNNINKEINFSMFNLSFILQIYVNPENADKDLSKSLSVKESVALALALSMDALAAGFGAGIADISYSLVLFSFLVVNTSFMVIACNLGGKVSEKINMDISWISGVLLIVLAFLKL